MERGVRPPCNRPDVGPHLAQSTNLILCALAVVHVVEFCHHVHVLTTLAGHRRGLPAPATAQHQTHTLLGAAGHVKRLSNISGSQRTAIPLAVSQASEAGTEQPAGTPAATMAMLWTWQPTPLHLHLLCCYCYVLSLSRHCLPHLWGCGIAPTCWVAGSPAVASSRLAAAHAVCHSMTAHVGHLGPPASAPLGLVNDCQPWPTSTAQQTTHAV